MNVEWLAEYGYLALFVWAFLSASLLPLSSEVAVVAMQALAYPLLPILFVASAGNTLGSLLNYGMGRRGSDRWLKKHDSHKRFVQAKAWYQRWGTPSLFFTWVPGIGDFLPIFAGIFHANIWIVTIWVAIGKVLRYAVLLGIGAWLWG
jgi:membrane protein YqaA with SNARE-associated domain